MNTAKPIIGSKDHTQPVDLLQRIITDAPQDTTSFSQDLSQADHTSSTQFKAKDDTTFTQDPAPKTQILLISPFGPDFIIKNMSANGLKLAPANTLSQLITATISHVQGKPLVNQTAKFICEGPIPLTIIIQRQANTPLRITIQGSEELKKDLSHHISALTSQLETKLQTSLQLSCESHHNPHQQDQSGQQNQKKKQPPTNDDTTFTL